VSQLKVISNRDGTLTVRCGRAVEHIGTSGKTKGEVFDCVKWAAISKGATFSDAALIELLQQAVKP